MPNRNTRTASFTTKVTKQWLMGIFFFLQELVLKSRHQRSRFIWLNNTPIENPKLQKYSP